MACAHCGRPWIVFVEHGHYDVAQGCLCHWLTNRALAPRVIHQPSTPVTGEWAGGWD